MKTVWKFELQIEDRQSLAMPRGSIVLTVRAVDDKIWLWAEVNPAEELETREIEIYGTGHWMPEVRRSTFVGSVFHGRSVFHIYVG